MSDAAKIALIAVGLIVFTFMIYISRQQRSKLKDRRRRIKDSWKDRLE